MPRSPKTPKASKEPKARTTSKPVSKPRAKPKASPSTKKRATARSTTRARPRPKSQKAVPLPELPVAGRLLALDISSVCVGWSLWDDGRLLEFGRYRQQGAEHGEKLVNFQQWLVDTFDTLDPDHVAFEAPYAGRRRHTFAVLSMYCAVVLMVHFERTGFEVPEENRVAAHQVKRRLQVRKGASHTENKKIMVQWANETFGLSLSFDVKDKTKRKSQDDEADAIAVGYAWYLIHGNTTDNN